MWHKELEKQKKALQHKRKGIEHKSKQIELKHHDLLKNKSAGASMSASTCCICQDFMAMTHNLRCGHTFCGLCIFKVTLNPKTLGPKLSPSSLKGSPETVDKAVDTALRGFTRSLDA